MKIYNKTVCINGYGDFNKICTFNLKDKFDKVIGVDRKAE